MADAPEADREASKARRVRFRPKDEVITIQFSDVSGPKGDGDNSSIVGTELVDIVEVTIRKVYRGIRNIHKSKPGKAKAISSSGKNDGTGVETPSLLPASDASVPDVPFVRSDVLCNYYRARDNGLPELSRKNFNLLNYLVAIMRAVLLRRNLKGSEEECHADLHDGNDGVIGRIVRPPMRAKATEKQIITEPDSGWWYEIPKGTPLPGSKDILAGFGCEGWRNSPLVFLRDCLLYTSPSPRDRG